MLLGFSTGMEGKGFDRNPRRSLHRIKAKQGQKKNETTGNLWKYSRAQRYEQIAQNRYRSESLNTTPQRS